MSDECAGCGGIGRVVSTTRAGALGDTSAPAWVDVCEDCGGGGWPGCPVCEDYHDPEEATSMCAWCGERTTCATLICRDGDYVCAACDEGPVDDPADDVYWVTK